jgi:membrane associated rhomboid family serine protease
VTVLLIALHAGIFVAQLLVALWQQEHMFVPERTQQWLGLSGDGIAEGRYWQFFSFMLLHESPLPFHVLGNMLVLYFAGREVEPIIGSRNMFTLYFLANLVGGVCHYFATPTVALVGVSAGAAAVLAAYATILPELEITANVFFVLPLRVRAKYLGVITVVIAATLWAAATAMSIGPAAILGGCLVGWIFAKQLGFGNPLAIQRYIFEKRQRAARLERMSAEQFISAEIDPILDKVSRQGMHSLTRSERKILEKGREKIAARTAAK